MAAKKQKTNKREMEELKPDFVEQEDSRNYEAIVDELRQDFTKPVAEIETTKSSFDAPEESLSVPLKDDKVLYGKVVDLRKFDFIYNRLASLEGYQGFGVSYRKDWEIEMALKTLHDLGGAHPNANILGVGAGTERTIFELANAQSAALVTASDIYNDAGVWDGWHGKEFLKNPHKSAPAGLPYDPARVAAMHVDMCDMPYEDEVYDAIFSSGSIEHVGNPKKDSEWEQVAKAAKEIGRVLKPGGIASISTEFVVSGEGWGFEGVHLFTYDSLMHYIVEPSGLELVGRFNFDYQGDLKDAVSQPDVVLGRASEENKPLLRYGDFLFTSVHIALRKPNK